MALARPILAMLLALLLQAGDPASLAHPAQHRYTDRDGLPQNSVNAMAYDVRGRLWVGTENGGAFWNGRGWTSLHMPKRKATDYVNAIAATGDEDLVHHLLPFIEEGKLVVHSSLTLDTPLDWTHGR